MGFWSGLGNILKKVAVPIAGAALAPVTGGASLPIAGAISATGDALGSVAQAQASNRGAMLDAMMAADNMKLLAGQDRRADESDIWKKLQAANYMTSGGSGETKPTMSASGQPFTSFNFGPKAISDEDKAMATTLKDQLLKRLNTVPTLRDYDSQMKPSGTEKTLNWLAPILSIGGNLLQGKQATTPKPTLNVPSVTVPPSIFNDNGNQYVNVPPSIFSPMPKKSPNFSF